MARRVWLSRVDAAEAVALARAGLGFDFGTQDEGLRHLLIEAPPGLPDSELGHRTRLFDLAAVIADRDGVEAPAVADLRDQARRLAEPIGLVLGGLGVTAAR